MYILNVRGSQPQPSDGLMIVLQELIETGLKDQVMCLLRTQAVRDKTGTEIAALVGWATSAGSSRSQ